MVFSSLTFLLLFFPVVVILYRLIPPVFSNGLLFLASLFFYAWGEPRYIWIMLFSTVFDYSNGRLLEYFEQSGDVGEGRKNRIRKGILCLSVVGNLVILAFFKYYDFVLANVNHILGSHFYGLNLALPIGISFYTFQTMSYTIDVYRGRVKAQHNIISFGMYVCLFPQLIAGPIVRYEEIAREIKDRVVTSGDLQEGIYRFARGLAKKVLLANQIGGLWKSIAGIENRSLGLAWMGAMAFTFQIYYDFSGYSDMAIGLGRIFGFHFPENFTHPYEARSITEFWRRWHRTLGQWFREYVYIPLGGNRCSVPRHLMNLLLVWTLTGLWHGAAWNFVIWGWFYGILLILEKYLYGRWLEKIPALFQQIYVMLTVACGWMIFAEENQGQILTYLGQMFHLAGGNPLWDGRAMFYLRGYGILFILLAFLAVEGWRNPVIVFITGFMGEGWKKNEKYEKEEKWEKNRKLVKMLLTLFFFVLSIIFLIGDAYNPFLYFRF